MTEVAFSWFASVCFRHDRESRLTEQLIGKLGYLGIALILILGGLGLPIPEEVPIIVAAVLTRNGKMTWPLAIGSCLAGVLLGDMVVYSLGFFYGEKVLSLPLTRRLLTRQREAQIKGYFHRHGFKILVSGRFVPGFRTAAYLTAGILKLPPVKLLLTDLVAASLEHGFHVRTGVCLCLPDSEGIREVQQWVTVAVGRGGGDLAARSLLPGRKPLGRAGRPAGSGQRRMIPLSIDDLPSVHRPAEYFKTRRSRPDGDPAPPGRRPRAGQSTRGAGRLAECGPALAARGRDG